jgi:hypothetical protein
VVGRVALGLAALALACGCAKKGPPSGGPPDLEPPRLVSSVPDSGSAGVARGATVSLTFSEGMEPRTTGDAVAFAPRVEIRQRRWKGNVLTLVLAESLAARQTYTVFVGGGARDRHGNPFSGGAAVVFSTADSFPAGRLEGEIQALGFGATGTYLWGYDADEGREPDSTARDFDAVGLADGDGRFRVTGLRVPGRWRLWAFVDLNGNRSFEPASDLLAPVDTVLALTPEAPVASGLVVRVVNPRAPTRVRGLVESDSLPDSTGVKRLIGVPLRDTTRAMLFEVRSDDSFDVPLVAGPWRLRAYLDRNRDQRWQSAIEAASDTLFLDIPPATELKDVRLRLRAPAAPREESP